MTDSSGTNSFSTSAGFTRTEREAMKAIYRLGGGGTEVATGALAEMLGVAPGTATATVKKLAERGLLDHRPYRGVVLTPAGQEVAVDAIRRHRICERFLADYLGYGWQDADRLAATFEHELPQEVEDRLYETLHRPAWCPHGFPIPHPEADEIEPMPRLADLEPGDGGEVALSGSLDETVHEYLESLGIRPGAVVEVLGVEPFEGPVQIRVDGRTAHLGERLACQIHVKVETPTDETLAGRRAAGDESNEEAP